MALIALAVLYPLAGRLGDRFGARRVLVPGILLFGFGMMSLSLVGANLPLYAILTILIGMAGVVQSPLLYSMVVTHRAPLRSRGKLIAICTTGVPLGNMAIPPLVVWLIAEFGWRGARVGLGLAILSLCASGGPPVHGRYPRAHQIRVREDAQRRSVGYLAPARHPAPVGDISQRACAQRLPCQPRCPWSPIAGFSLRTPRAFSSWRRSPASSDASVRAGSLTVCRNRRSASSGMSPARSASACPSIPAVRSILTIGSICLGLALGAETELGAYYTSRFYDRKHFGEVLGLLSCFYTIGGALGGQMFSLFFDQFGDYRPRFDRRRRSSSL